MKKQRKDCGPSGCKVPRARVQKKGNWPCHNCPETFGSLRELNDHNFDRAGGSRQMKPCSNPNPTPAWYMDRFEILMKEIADLKARIRHANKWVGHVNPDQVKGALNLRKKNWRKA